MAGLVEAEIAACLREAGVEPDEPVGLGYSGGVDSTALLAGLCALPRRRPLAIYVDHTLRPKDERVSELELVRRNCLVLGADLAIARIATGAIARRAESSGCGIEAAAREFRYAAFSGALRRGSAKRILLAHTRDDQAETLLMRLFGGAGAGGLRGIPKASGVILRPFLGIPKSELIAYLSEKGIAHAEDSTNSSACYRRNRIRLLLVPLLDASFPGWRTALATIAERAAMEDDALTRVAAPLAFRPSPDPSSAGTASTPLAALARELLDAPDELALRSILAAASSLLGRDRLPRRMAKAALSALRGAKGSSYAMEKNGGKARLYCGAGIRLRRESDRLIMERGLDFPPRDGYFVVIDGPRRVSAGRIDVSAAWAVGAEPGIRADAFRFPLVVRSRRPGDSLALPGGGAKRLDELLSEWDLPARRRGSVPVVEDRDGIVAILGSAAGVRDRYRPSPSSGDARRLAIIVKGA